MNGIVLHTCCGPCASACTPVLMAEGARPLLYFANSNLDTRAEYERRLESAQRLAAADGVELVAEPYDHAEWLAEVARGYEDAPEKGARCARCFRYNLGKTAAWAAAHGYTAFTSSLTLSPHKPSAVVFAAGRAAELPEVAFRAYDFKKRNGFLTSLARTRELALYRQDYCGCEFSKRGRGA